MDFDFDFSWGSDVGDEKTFTKRHEASEKVIDFSDAIQRNALMRFEVVSSLDFEIPKPEQSYFAITTKDIDICQIPKT